MGNDRRETRARSSSSVDIEEVSDVEVRAAVLELLLETGPHTGDSFFTQLTKSICNYFAFDHVFLCELVLERRSAKLIAHSQNSDAIIDVENLLRQGLRDQAFETVIETGEVALYSNAPRRFPLDRIVTALNASALVGVALPSQSGDTIGVLLVAHSDPMPAASMTAAVLRSLAPRVGAELERRMREAASERMDARLRLLADRSQDVLFFLQVMPSLELQYISPSFEAMFGHPVEALHVNPDLLLEMMEPEDRDEFETAFVSGEGGPLVAKMHLPDGSVRWVEYRDFLVQADGRSIGGAIRDITARVEAESALRASEQYVRHLLECIPDTLVLLRSDGTVLDYVPGEVDPGFGRPEEVKGHNLAEVTAPAIAAVLDRATRGATRSHSVKRVQFKVPGAKPRFYDASCMPFGDDSLLLVLRDLTAQRWSESEEERQQLRERIDERVETQTKINPYGLTYRELAVLNLVVEGMADKQIADALGISIYTVNKHVGNVLGKMNAVSRTEAGVRAVKEGLLSIGS